MRSVKNMTEPKAIEHGEVKIEGLEGEKGKQDSPRIVIRRKRKRAAKRIVFMKPGDVDET